MTWFFFSILSVIFFAVLNLIQRKIAVDSKYPRAAAVVFNIYGASLAIILFFITGGLSKLSWPQGIAAWIFMIIATFFYALYERGRFLSAKLLDASSLSIVANVSLAIAFIGALFLYSESLTPEKVAGVVLIIVSLIVVSFQKNIKNKISLKGVLVGIMVFTFLGLAWMLDKKGTLYFNPDTYSLLVWTVPLFMIYFPYVKPAELKHEAKQIPFAMFILALLNVVGYYFQLLALQLADATRVIPLVQTSTLVTVVLGILILGEKENIPRKIAAAIIGFAGALLLVI